MVGTEEEAIVAGPYEFQVRVKYVRRELRSLTDQDREMFFNAVAVLQRVPSAVGQEVYGSNYYSKDFMTRLHLYYGERTESLFARESPLLERQQSPCVVFAKHLIRSFCEAGGTKDCDHWHQGAGFVTSHMGLTLMYEQSLQAVNPAVSVPYWDFTLESTFFGASDFRDSGVFADDWFGSASPDNVSEMEFPYQGSYTLVEAVVYFFRSGGCCNFFERVLVFFAVLFVF